VNSSLRLFHLDAASGKWCRKLGPVRQKAMNPVRSGRKQR